MSITTTKLDSSQLASETAVYLFDDWFDPIEAGVRDRVREFIQAMVEGFAAANDLVGKSDVEVREAIGDKFPKHIYHSIVCIGARAIRPAAPPPAEKPIACQDEVRQSTGRDQAGR